MFIDTSISLNNFQDINGGGGGVSTFDHIGNTSGNITLAANKITTAHFTGNHTVTLPTVTSSQQETCILDFTTVNAAYPSITNTNVKNLNGQTPPYFTGTISLPTITGASNTSPIEITSTSHGCVTGDTVLIASVGGNTAANGTWVITKTGTNTFTLNGSVGNSNYTSGGTASKYVTRNRFTFISILGTDCWELEGKCFGGVLQPFTRPNLTGDGTLGGSSFAVSCNLANAFYAVDGNGGTYCGSNTANPNATFIIYNPRPLNVSNINISTGVDGNHIASAGSVYGSNDNSTYTYLSTYSNSSSSFNINLSSITEFYKYIQIINTNTLGGYDPFLYEIAITATELVL